MIYSILPHLTLFPSFFMSSPSQVHDLIPNYILSLTIVSKILGITLTKESATKDHQIDLMNIKSLKKEIEKDTQK